MRPPARPILPPHGQEQTQADRGLPAGPLRRTGPPRHPRRVESLFARFNTGRDGADPKGQYTLPLHGPGFTAEVPTAVNPVVQVMLSVYDEELAMPVLIRMARDLGVRLTDIESGQTFG